MAETNPPEEDPTALLAAKRKSDLSSDDCPAKSLKLDAGQNLQSSDSNAQTLESKEEPAVEEEDEDEDEDDDEASDFGSEEDDDDEDENSDGEAAVADRKGKGIMKDEKGKGKLIVEDEDSGDDSSDGGLSDDPLAEVDLDNILPSRTRRRQVQPGVYISNDLPNDDDSDDSDA